MLNSLTVFESKYFFDNAKSTNTDLASDDVRTNLLSFFVGGRRWDRGLGEYLEPLSQ